MKINLLKSKLHRVITTATELDYEGSCAIDVKLMQAANIHEYEQIHIYNISNGNRFITYAIKAKANSGVISINGAAAHKAKVGDILIIASYVQLEEKEIANFKPKLVYVDTNNQFILSGDSTTKI